MYIGTSVKLHECKVFDMFNYLRRIVATLLVERFVEHVVIDINIVRA